MEPVVDLSHTYKSQVWIGSKVLTTGVNAGGILCIKGIEHFIWQSKKHTPQELLEV